MDSLSAYEVRKLRNIYLDIENAGSFGSKNIYLYWS